MATATQASLPFASSVTVTINGQSYTLTKGEIESDQIRAAYKLVSANGKPYYLRDSRLGVVTCSCEDYIYRHMGTTSLCKHGKALVAAGLASVRREEPQS